MNTSKKNNSDKLYLLFGVALIAGVIFLLYLFLRMFLNWFSTLENQVAAAVATLSVTALISIGSLILSKHYEHKREIRKEHNTKKIPIYEELISFMFNVLFAEKAGDKPPTEQEIIKFLNGFTQKLIIWGDEGVIKSFCLFRDKAANMNSSKPDPTIMFLVEEMWLTMRKDLGHKDKKIKRGDLLSLFITDIKKYLPQESA